MFFPGMLRYFMNDLEMVPVAPGKGSRNYSTVLHRNTFL